MAALLAPIKSACAADAAALAVETKSLFADVRSCKAAVAQMQVTALFPPLDRCGNSVILQRLLQRGGAGSDFVSSVRAAIEDIDQRIR